MLQKRSRPNTKPNSWVAGYIVRVMLKLRHDCNVGERSESGWFASQFRFALNKPQDTGFRKVAPHCGYPEKRFFVHVTADPD